MVAVLNQYSVFYCLIEGTWENLNVNVDYNFSVDFIILNLVGNFYYYLSVWNLK